MNFSRMLLLLSLFILFAWPVPARADIGGSTDIHFYISSDDDNNGYYDVILEGAYWYTYDEAYYYDLALDGEIWDLSTSPETRVASGSYSPLTAAATPGHDYYGDFATTLVLYFFDTYQQLWYDPYGYSEDGGGPYPGIWIKIGVFVELFVDVYLIYDWVVGEDGTTSPPTMTIDIPAQNSVVRIDDATRRFHNLHLKASASPNQSATVNWQLKYEYNTSTPRQGWTDYRTESSQIGQEISNSYSGSGGLLTISAVAVFDGNRVEKKRTIHVPGSTIDAADITSRLLQLYSDCTCQGKYRERLMTGIAKWESGTYQQFKNFTLFGRPDLWPLEDGLYHGSHIGLMMVTPAMERAFDWHANTEDGVDYFCSDRMYYANNFQTIVKNAVAGLGDLPPGGLELVALELYGDQAGNCVPFADK